MSNLVPPYFDRFDITGDRRVLDEVQIALAPWNLGPVTLVVDRTWDLSPGVIIIQASFKNLPGLHIRHSMSFAELTELEQPQDVVDYLAAIFVEQFNKYYIKPPDTVELGEN